MAKIPEEVINLFTDPQASKVLATVDPDGILQAGAKGRFHVVDEETMAFAEMAQVMRKPVFKAKQKASIAIFKLPSFGYQIQGTFQEYQTVAMYDEWAKRAKEAGNLDITRVGIIKVDEIYSFAQRGDFGKKIA